MLFSKQNSLEDTLIQMLLKGASTIKELHASASSTSKPVSLRAVYKAIDGLLDAGVVVKAGKRVWIHQPWVRTVRERVSSSVPPLGTGERATYTFTSLEHLDAFWKTIAFQFEEYERDGQIFFYNPHNFWAYIPELRKSEHEYYKHFAASKKRAFFAVGGTNTADVEFKREYQNTFLQIDTRDVPSIARGEHITVVGDFVITAKLSATLARKIDELYQSDSSIDELMPAILKHYRANASVRLVLEHNPTKAKKLRTLLSKNFVLK